MTDTITTVRIVRLPHAVGLPMPAYQERLGLKLLAAVPDDDPTTIGPCERRLIPTGLVAVTPAGLEVQIRSSPLLAAGYGVVAVSPGVMEDYHGEIAVLLFNLNLRPFVVNRGDPIGWAVISPVVRANLVEVEVAQLEAVD
jgi:dUTP pyrophosphatase